MIRLLTVGIAGPLEPYARACLAALLALGYSLLSAQNQLRLFSHVSRWLGHRRLLTRPEFEALLASPDQATVIGRRDHALLLLAIQTGLRVSELTQLRVEDVRLDRSGAHVRCRGKGRKERVTPLTVPTARALRAWLKERHPSPTDPLFASRRGDVLSRDAIERVVDKYRRSAATKCRSLETKRVSPHVLRHTSAMILLHAGGDRSVIALWLGHESVETTEIYLHTDLSIKERAIARTAPPRVGRKRYRPTDRLLAFLEAL